MAVEVWHWILEQINTVSSSLFQLFVRGCKATMKPNSQTTSKDHESSHKFSSILWMLTEILCSIFMYMYPSILKGYANYTSCHIQSYIGMALRQALWDYEFACLVNRTTQGLNWFNLKICQPNITLTTAKCVLQNSILPSPTKAPSKRVSTHLNHSIQLEKLQVQLFKILLKNLSQAVVTHYLHQQCKGLLLWKLQM